MNKSTMRGRIVALLIMTMAFALLAVPAWATPIGNHATLEGPRGSVDLYGLEDAAAISAIASVTPQPIPGTLTLVMNGRALRPITVIGPTWSSVWVDKAAIIADARRSRPGTDTFTIKPQYAVSEARVGVWVKQLNTTYGTTARNASLAVSSGKLVLVPERTGYQVYYRATVATVVRALKANAAEGKKTPMRVNASVVATKAKITGASFNKTKTIIVSLSKRALTLYTGTGVTKFYRCAVGRPAYPTPTGTMTVYTKNPRPSWTNPGSAWAANMPSYIGPGASNPLGLRALYLKNAKGVDQGIRIHGTYNKGSIGTAASHGCIRLWNPNVVALYPLVPVGTKVYVIK